MKKLLGSSDFLVNAPQYDGEEVFGSAKRRPHVELGTDDDSHRFHNINFYHPQTHAKPLRINLHDSPSASVEHDLEVDVFALHVGNKTSSVAEPVHHVTVVQKNDCDAQQWHIHHMLFVGKKNCFAM